MKQQNHHHTLANLDNFVQLLTYSIGSQPFTLWLRGDLGAGKTTLTRHLLYNLGLDKDAVVHSPTYTYVTDYQIKHEWIAHLDLYRFPERSLWMDLGLDLYRDYRGVIIEWPERILDLEDTYPATHLVSIEHDHSSGRIYSLSTPSTRFS